MATSLPPSSSASAIPSSSFVSTAPVMTNAVESSQHIELDPQTDHDDSESSRTVAVPRCSTWFAMDKINPIEKRMLPEFFGVNAAKTAELYLKYRNFMVHAYRQQPSVYLTATACRRNLAGDACAILRVHEFLTHWGLINFHVPPHAMPPAVHPNYALKSVEETHIKEEMGPVAMLVAATKESGQQANKQLSCEVCGTVRESNLSFFELTPEVKKRVMCNGATSGNATPVASGNPGDKELTLGGIALRPGSGICEHCYVRGAFPEGYDAVDFILMPSLARNELSWTQDETNVMLEALSNTRQEQDESCDWNFVASKVGTKTAKECLMHFLELPILDQMGISNQSFKPYKPGEVLNAPVLNLVALVEQVDPFVAKAAAQAAIGAIKRLHTMPIIDTIKNENIPETTNENASFEAASNAVALSSQTAGIAVKIKSEDVDDVIVPVKCIDDSKKAQIPKEVIAVSEEAANATTVALLATRAQQIAGNTANGPIRELVNQLLENQLQQIELKMEQLHVLEQTMIAEKMQIAEEKYQLYVDRLAFAQEKVKGRMT
ncbi:smarcc1 protein [Plasmopara halstedii]|uniref:Smarcc1 protein n=1 Tax=Plasmopara halstedii TaxID=4781 RepID=A0A0P1AXT6_PLAHL|nr:smarcc1 protein [Plasmopara halstedii]CEG46269.1 smarcc1 protein [Plasmopara halstedii]|eukprot:XP_024582638.1 smarcc1 protein [Plasmopara halstedii]